MKIGFVSTRIAGADGVSLEIAKLATICRRLGHAVCYCAGELEPWLADDGMLVPAMHFAHPEARAIHDLCFGTTVAAAGGGAPPLRETVAAEGGGPSPLRETVAAAGGGPPPLRQRIAAMSADLKAAIGRFVADFGVDLLFVQNALAIPMHIPLGVALTDYIAETGIPTLAHNHDLPWERERFAVNCVPDILERCFPPNLPSVRHLAINSLAQRALRERKGIEATLFPNIFDFATAAPGISDFNADLRQALGLGDDQLFILQPTRVVPRKGIELAIELVRRLRGPGKRARLGGKEAVLVITHPAGDEGLDYLERIQAQAQAVGVPLLYAADRFASERGWRNGQKIYSLWDAYVHADFVTYPSLIEGFGNALLEAIYFRLPVLVNRYPVYAADIGPRGFDLIEVDAAITDRAVDETIAVLADPVRRRRMVERNYELARGRYSYEAVTPLLATLLEAARP